MVKTTNKTHNSSIRRPVTPWGPPWLVVAVLANVISSSCAGGGQEKTFAHDNHLHSASHGSSGGHHNWWHHEYEYDHFEAYCVVVLLLVTLVFEAAHHRLEHFAQETYAFGSKEQCHRNMHAQEHGHAPLWACLVRRATAEFTVLGFLAFVVWSFNQGEVFDRIHEIFEDHDGVVLPPDGTSYLHTVEAVHMHLFMAMILYFFVLAGSIHSAVWYMYDWQQSAESLLESYSNGSIQAGTSQSWCDGKSESSLRYYRLRIGFLTRFEQWSGKWAFWDAHIGPLVPKDCSLSLHMEPWFPFSQYLALNFRAVLDDMIEIKPSTWLAIISIQIAQAQVHYAKKDIDFPHLWIGISFILVVCINFFSYTRLRSLQSHDDHQAVVTASSVFCHKLSWDILINRCLQACTVLICFELASTIGSKHRWQDEHIRAETIAYTIICGVGVVPFGYFLGILLARFAGVMACGSLISEQNVYRIAIFLEKRAKGASGRYLQDLSDDVEALDEAVEEERHELQATTHDEGKKNVDDEMVISASMASWMCEVYLPNEALSQPNATSRPQLFEDYQDTGSKHFDDVVANSTKRQRVDQ